MYAAHFHPFAQTVSKERATKRRMDEMAAKRHHQEESSFVSVTPAESLITSDSRPSKKLHKVKQHNTPQTGDGPHIPPVISQNPEPSSSTPGNPSLSSRTPVAGPSTRGPIPGPDGFYDIPDGDHVMAAAGSSA